MIADVMPGWRITQLTATPTIESFLSRNSALRPSTAAKYGSCQYRSDTCSRPNERESRLRLQAGIAAVFARQHAAGERL